MRRIIGTLMVCLLVAHPVVFAAEPADGTLAGPPLDGTRIRPADGVIAAAAARESDRLARAVDGTALPSAQQGESRKRGWIGRHPALFGALVGAGVGAVSAGTMENELFCSGGDEDCLFYGGGRLLLGAGPSAPEQARWRVSSWDWAGNSGNGTEPKPSR